jgi:hypothetical protein
MERPGLRALRGDHATAVEVLTSMAGQALSYAQLEERGVPRPAVVCYELAAAGWPIERGMASDPNGASRLGVRMAGAAAGGGGAPPPAPPPRSGFRRLWGAPVP